VDRAVSLKYDEHEQAAPAAFAAGMSLFNAVLDALEGSHEDDSRWLDAATTALESAEGWGRSEMRHVLLVVRQEDVISSDESRTIRAAVAEIPEATALSDVTLTRGELAEAVTSVLRTVQAYRAALGSTGP